MPPPRSSLVGKVVPCFRIPAITINPKTGTLHAFAEARRGDLGDLPGWHGFVGDAPVLCPDVRTLPILLVQTYVR